MLVLEALAGISSTDLRAPMLLGILALALVPCALFVTFFLLTSLCEFLNLLLNFEDLAAHNVQLVRFNGHLCFDLLDLLLF